MIFRKKRKNVKKNNSDGYSLNNYDVSPEDSGYLKEFRSNGDEEFLESDIVNRIDQDEIELSPNEQVSFQEDLEIMPNSSVNNDGMVEDILNDVTADSSKSNVDDILEDMGDYSNDTSKEIVIKVDNITMEYKITKEKIDTIKEFVIRSIKRNKSSVKKFKALKNISFEVQKGDRVGVIGFNGAGKSTLLKVLSGVYEPTYGSIMTKGKIAPLLELGAGFDENYTGKANIFLNGAFLGFSENFLKEKYDEILEFSELGEAINYPVKNYSSGMRSKLGFSIATLVEPDILIIDEILSVGDIKFQRKSAEKLRSLIDSGITVLLVSHSVSQIRDICNKAIWIDNGEIVKMGEVNEVCDAYVVAANGATESQLKNINLN